jgi:peptidoglycan/LPS O-acetylase OafA/YrhL
MAEPAPGQKPRFFPYLEPIRGFAAVSVVFVHCFAAFEPMFHLTGAGAIVAGGLFTVVSGHNAVMLFFVLSGFVLYESIRLEPICPRLFATFLVRRACRMLPVALVSLALASVVVTVLRPGPDVLRYGAPWFTNGFGSLTPHDLAANFLFLSNRINVVYWSLSVELAASAVFVPLAYYARRFGVAAQVALLVLLVAVSYASFGQYWGGAQQSWWSLALLPVPDILMFLFCFHLGILTNQLRAAAGGARIIRHVAPYLGLCLLGVGQCRFANPPPAALVWLCGLPVKIGALVSMIEAVGACLVVFAWSHEGGKWTRSVLGSRLARALGRWSYGIYCVHIVIFKVVFVLAVMALGAELTALPWLGPAVALCTVLPASIAAAALLRASVELPGIRLGKMFVARTRR